MHIQHPGSRRASWKYICCCLPDFPLLFAQFAKMQKRSEKVMLAKQEPADIETNEQPQKLSKNTVIIG